MNNISIPDKGQVLCQYYKNCEIEGFESQRVAMYDFSLIKNGVKIYYNDKNEMNIQSCSCKKCYEWLSFGMQYSFIKGDKNLGKKIEYEPEYIHKIMSNLIGN